jgi:[acyl-carrier-protein] S-malonyltransferase
MCAEGPKEKLDSTAVSQPAIYVASLAAVEKLKHEQGEVRTKLAQAATDRLRRTPVGRRRPALTPPAIPHHIHRRPAPAAPCSHRLVQEAAARADVACGLSLGEYTALAYAGAVSFEDGVRLVKLRGESMQAAADATPSAMVSVIGLDAAKTAELCEAASAEVPAGQGVRIANFLCSGNYAVSGGVAGCEAVERLAKGFKARMTVRLAVAGAFHTDFMQPAVGRLQEALAATPFAAPRIPVISNVDALPHSDPEVIRAILARQVTSPVLWEDTMRALLDKGLEEGFEIGPNKVIAGIMKRVDKTFKVVNVTA